MHNFLARNSHVVSALFLCCVMILLLACVVSVEARSTVLRFVIWNYIGRDE